MTALGSKRVAISDDEKLQDTRTGLSPPRSRFRIFNLLGAASSQDCAIKLHKSATFEKGTCALSSFRQERARDEGHLVGDVQDEIRSLGVTPIPRNWRSTLNTLELISPISKRFASY